MKCAKLLLLLACAACCTPLLFAQDAPPDARQLLQSAHEVSGLASVVPYELRANVVINPGTPNEKKGRIVIYRDKDRSRTDLQVEDYREVKVTLGNKLYVARSTPMPIPGLGRLTETDHAWDRLSEDGAAKLGDVSHKKVQNVQANCFDVKGPAKHRLCFDPAKKVLLENLDQRLAVELSDYAAVSDSQNLFPRRITVLLELEKSEKPVLIIQEIEVLRALFPANAFAVPEHSMEFDACENMQPAKLLESPRPDFGQSVVRRNMAAGAVNVYGIIDKEGKVQNVQVLSSDADVQKDVREALKKWRFSPAMCGSTPVATEREIQIPFFDFGGQGGGPRSR